MLVIIFIGEDCDFRQQWSSLFQMTLFALLPSSSFVVVVVVVLLVLVCVCRGGKGGGAFTDAGNVGLYASSFVQSGMKFNLYACSSIARGLCAIDPTNGVSLNNVCEVENKFTVIVFLDLVKSVPVSSPPPPPPLSLSQAIDKQGQVYVVSASLEN